MALTPTTMSSPTNRRRVRVVVATMVLGLVGALPVLVGGADRAPNAATLRPVLLAGGGVPTPPALVIGSIVPVGDDAADAPGAAEVAPEVAPVVEVVSAGAPVHASPPGAPGALDPPPIVPAAPPTTEPPMPEQAPVPTGTLEVQVTPADEGASRQVSVETPDGAEVVERAEVTGPIVVELAAGTYAVFIETTGPPYGPDGNRIALGGGSSVTRDVVEVVAGRTTTVTCSTC